MQSPIIFFDGVCNLCNNFIQLIIRNDRKEKFLFCTIQSDFARNFFLENKFSSQDSDSVILYMDGTFYTKSSAALRIAKSMNGLWPIFWIFITIPSPIRNWVYDFVAKNRMKWFGRRSECIVPSTENKKRFL